MEFQLAAELMHNSFTLNEKELAKSYPESFYHDEPTQTVYVRRACLQLQSVIEEVQEYIRVHNHEYLCRLVLYCDTIDLPEGLVVGYEDPAKHFELRVFARKVQCQNPSNALRMHFSIDCQLAIYTYALQEGFTVHFLFPDREPQPVRLSIDEDKWGIQINWDESDFHIEQQDSRDLDMTTADYLSRIKSDGTLEKRSFVRDNDNLPRLVAYQFLVAATVIRTKPKLALDILNWVCNLSASESSVALNIQACSLRNSLVLSQERKVFNVPSVNIYASKQILESRLAASMAFEQAFQNFVAQERASAAILGQTMNLIAKNEDAMSEYAFLEDVSQKAYCSAQSARESAFERYNKNNTNLIPLQNAFSKGLDNWVKEKNIAHIINVIKGVVTTIKGIYDKLQPILEKLQTLAETIQNVVAALNASQTLKEKTALQRPDMSLDIFNATALWDIFREKIDDIEKTLSEIDFEAKGKYFFALKTLVINGKTYLQTQENLCQRGNELALVLLKVKLQHKDQKRLALSATATEQQGAVLDLLKRAMFDRLLTIRSLVFLDFQIYSEAYMFHALTDRPPVHISPVKPVPDYLEDAAKFQANIATFGSRVMVQQRKFSILTCGDAADATGLQSRLLKGDAVNVTLSPKNPMFAGFSRIRVSKARCYLEGAITAVTENGLVKKNDLRLLLRTSGRFYDINLPGSKKDAPAEYNAYVGDARTLLFEYNIDDGSITCDAEYGQRLDYTQHSPLTEWEISIAPGGLQAKDLNMSGITGLRMELWCDFTLRL
ncbi:hypothetical protein FCULG_00009152 [Fusarium culmorum]|uniref:Uncharacterized protein n=1 Tax=Fusarium culmorum TaxID=5516 RepID=A0A2T4GI11_FUSCU|nr:hypothetical protein FCULG_00009152 [Fusarium culmorum]